MWLSCQQTAQNTLAPKVSLPGKCLFAPWGPAGIWAPELKLLGALWPEYSQHKSSQRQHLKHHLIMYLLSLPFPPHTKFCDHSCASDNKWLLNEWKVFKGTMSAQFSKNFVLSNIMTKYSSRTYYITNMFKKKKKVMPILAEFIFLHKKFTQLMVLFSVLHS